jgi:hypothetical protein
MVASGTIWYIVARVIRTVAPLTFESPGTRRWGVM